MTWINWWCEVRIGMNDERLQQLLSKLPSEGAKRLEFLLDRMYTGVPEDYRTPLFDGRPREELIEELVAKVGYTRFEELTQIDHREKEKIGPYSIMLPADERRDSLSGYWQQSWSPDEEALDSAFHSVAGLVKQRSLRAASLETAFSVLPDGNLGLPWVTRDKAYAGYYLERAIKAKTVTDWYPFIWYWRGQPNGIAGPPKQRDIWGSDHVDTILSLSIQGPCLTALRRLPGFSAWVGQQAIDEEATRILRKANGRQVLSGDYSGFDKSLPYELMLIADDVLAEWFAIRDHARIYLLGEARATVDIVVPYDVLGGRKGGMPSGHGLTNLVDSIVNLLAIHYIAFRLGVQVEDYTVMGDDFVVLYSQDVDLEELAKVVLEIGLVANAEKQYVSTRSLHFCQQWHSLDYTNDKGVLPGAHSPYRTASGLYGYERYKNPKIWSKEMDSVRAIGQLEVCADDPRHRELVEYTYDGDKVMQSKMDPLTMFRRAGSTDIIRQALGIGDFPFNAKTPDIEKFSTFKTAREYGAG
jgi:hypothetical protein